MARFKPLAFTDNRNLTATKHTYNTYRELLRDMPRLTKLSYGLEGEQTVRVTRSRRGEWGEWFEIWEGGVKIREGWM